MWSMYPGVGKIFSRYWRAYGGVAGLFRSPYLHLALLASILTFHTWMNELWWQDVISVLPNLIGFTLGGLAIFIGFGDEKFRTLLADPDEKSQAPSIYVGLCATFVHFILIQALALLFAVVAKALKFHWAVLDPWWSIVEKGNWFFGWAGYFLFLYALTSIIAVTMHVFRISTMYEQYRRMEMRRRQEVHRRQAEACGVQNGTSPT